MKPDNLDLMSLRGLSAHGFHGVFDHEKRDGQTFVVDLDLGIDLRKPAKSGRLADTVNYAEIADGVHAVLTGEPFDLIESVALRIMDLCFDHSPVSWVCVTVHKPEAPIEAAFSDVAVTLERSRA
jgi:dihydroneopterin aldolase